MKIFYYDIKFLQLVKLLNKIIFIRNPHRSQMDIPLGLFSKSSS